MVDVDFQLQPPALICFYLRYAGRVRRREPWSWGTGLTVLPVCQGSLSPVQPALTVGLKGRENHSEQKANSPHGMFSHPSHTPGKRAEICPSQAKPHFLLSFCLLQGDAGIQGYPGRKVRRAAPMLFSELSALMLCGVMAENLWAALGPPVELCPAGLGLAAGPQIVCCHCVRRAWAQSYF